MDEMYTDLSQMAFDQALEPSLDAEDVLDALATIQPRSFAEVLLKFSQGKELRPFLLQGYLRHSPTRVRDSVMRNIRDWLAGRRAPMPGDRDVLWELCFVMDLTVPQADEFLASTSDTGIHWRDPYDLTYAFALNNRMLFSEAQAFYKEKIAPIIAGEEADQPEIYTSIVKSSFQKMKEEKQLIAYIREHVSKLGAWHNRAWKKFMDYLRVLKQPETFNGMKEKKMSTRDVLAEYFCIYLPDALDRREKTGVALPTKHEAAAMAPVFKCIMEYWPDEDTISRIIHREAGVDVPRKALMLLFLATDGLSPAVLNAASQDDMDYEDLTLKSYARLDTMLSDCGYRRIDPRNAFDWLVLYCMRSVSDDDFASGAAETLKRVLAVLFPYNDPDAPPAE